jgi:hypothetical protein
MCHFGSGSVCDGFIQRDASDGGVSPSSGIQAKRFMYRQTHVKYNAMSEIREVFV